MSRSRRTFTALAAVATAIVGAGFAAPSAVADTVLLAPHMLMPDGTIKDDMGVLIGDDGRIQRVESLADLADHPRAVRLPEGSVLSPGLIDLASSAGAFGHLGDGTEVMDPDASAVESFDPHAPGAVAALEAGVTSVMIVPGFSGLVDGVSATVRTTPAADGSADVLVAEGSMMLGMGGPALATDLGPTSRSGAMPVLRRAMRNAGDGDDRMARMAGGQIAVVARVEQAEDASAMLRLLDRADLVPVIAIGGAAVEIAEEAADYGATILTGPYGMTSSERLLSGAAACNEAGTPVAFIGGSPAGSPHGLRITAALAAASGMPAADARRGMTSISARVAGCADRIGAIRVGRHADLVVFSGDPLRLDTRVLEVMVAGRTVHRASHAHHDSGDAR